MNDEYYLKLAIEQSTIAEERGEYPYGAILVRGNEVVSSAYNTTHSTRDIAAHAELTVIREVGQRHGEVFLKESTLYSSCEPCVMCAGAIYWSGILRIVFSCSVELDANISEMPFAIPCRSILTVDGGHKIEVRGPLLEEESAAVLRRFWTSYLRNNKTSFGLTI